ncbi:MAG TPA: putative lipid II flippase FtsW [Gammaproteobacteria bacterium]|nr:putative lipid II flippase FtsW [Gammaproteobacteria bacterium]
MATNGAARTVPIYAGIDLPLLGTALALLALGLVMVGSASISVAEHQHGQPFYFLYRQCAYIIIGLALAAAVTRIPISFWQRTNTMWLVAGIVLLVAVLLPGVGREVNGSVRWLPLGVVRLQVSEPVKLIVVLYLGAYLARRVGTEITAKGLLEPIVILSLISLLLLLEPDFGATAVILTTALGMMFLGGVKWRHFALALLVVVACLAAVAVLSPYRFQRLTVFLNPWSDPFASGFQLTQALIAFGRGEWFGVGLGASVQKLFYLPEAYTDFLVAVLGEELGLAGVVAVIVLFGFMIWRAFVIADAAGRCGKWFAAYIAYGVAMWIGLQVIINIGVNMGVLPTKGLTLPLMSYGGSSIVTTCIAIALLLRVQHETRMSGASSLKGVKAW